MDRKESHSSHNPLDPELQEFNGGDSLEGLESLVNAKPTGNVPSDLLEQCLATIPSNQDLSQVESWIQSSEGNGQPTQKTTNGTSVPSRVYQETELKIDLEQNETGLFTRIKSLDKTVLWTAEAITAVCVLVVLFLVFRSGNTEIENPANPNEVAISHGAEDPTPEVPTPDPNIVPPSVPDNHLVVTPEPNTPQVTPDPETITNPQPEPIEIVDNSTPTERFTKELKAKNFTKAVAAVKQVKSIQQRETFLAQIAMAQALGGDLNGAVDTASLMESDSARTELLYDMPKTPFSRLRGAGGGTQADFDSLIELMTSTIAPDSWAEVGGAGSVQPFVTGVFVDAHGVLKKLQRDAATKAWLDNINRNDNPQNSVSGDVRRRNMMRKVSLTRLEKQIQLRLAAGLPIEEEMHRLAGLHRIEYVMVYPETGDIVIAGPAGDWEYNDQGYVVNVDTRRPVLQLLDLITVLRHFQKDTHDPFGVMIEPRKEGLKNVQEFVKESNKQDIAAKDRPQWLKDLASSLGRQDIRFFGDLDESSRVAHVLTEADYRMKLMGIGLEPGTLNVQSILDRMDINNPEMMSDLSVIRWWFAMNYNNIFTNEDKSVFKLDGQGVKVMSEKEFLTKDGERIHTNKTNILIHEFAANFTKHFENVSTKYPIYAEMQNMFDMAMVAAIIEDSKLVEKTDWHETFFYDHKFFPIPRINNATEVDTVVNHRVFDKKEIVAVISGGCRVDPYDQIKNHGYTVEGTGELSSSYERSQPREDIHPKAWWWD